MTLDPKKGFFIVQLETRDDRVVGMFNDSSSMPEFPEHETTLRATFGALDNLKHRSEVIQLGEAANGAKTITVGVNKFDAQDALTFSQMTSNSDVGASAPIDRVTYRGSGYNYQRTSSRGTAVKGQLESTNLISLDA